MLRYLAGWPPGSVYVPSARKPMAKVLPFRRAAESSGPRQLPYHEHAPDDAEEIGEELMREAPTLPAPPDADEPTPDTQRSPVSGKPCKHGARWGAGPKLVLCGVCHGTFKTYNYRQQTCSRECGGVARSRKARAKREAKMPARTAVDEIRSARGAPAREATEAAATEKRCPSIPK